MTTNKHLFVNKIKNECWSGHDAKLVLYKIFTVPVSEVTYWFKDAAFNESNAIMDSVFVKCCE